MACETYSLAQALAARYRIPCMFRIKWICAKAGPTYPYELPEDMECDNPLEHGSLIHQYAFGCQYCLRRLRDPKMQGSERLFRTMLATMRTSDWRIEFGDLQTKLTTGVI